MKKIISLLLAATMILALAIPAFAAETPAEAFAKWVSKPVLTGEDLAKKVASVVPGTVTIAEVVARGETADDDVVYAAAATTELEAKDLEKQNKDKEDIFEYTFTGYDGKKITLEAVYGTVELLGTFNFANAVAGLFSEAQLVKALGELYNLNEKAAKDVIAQLVEDGTIAEFQNGYIVTSTPKYEENENVEVHGPITEGTKTTFYFVNKQDGKELDVSKVKEVKYAGVKYTKKNGGWADLKSDKNRSLATAADKLMEDGKTYYQGYPETIEVEGKIYYFTGSEQNPVYRAFPTGGSIVILTTENGKITGYVRGYQSPLPEGLEKVTPAAAEETKEEAKATITEVKEGEKVEAAKKAMPKLAKAYTVYEVKAAEGATKATVAFPIPEGYNADGLKLINLTTKKEVAITVDKTAKTATAEITDFTAAYALYTLEGSPKTGDSTVVFSLIPAMALCVAAPVVLFARKKED